MSKSRYGTHYNGIMLGRLYWATSENGGFQLVVQTPLFGFVYGRKFRSLVMDGTEYTVSFGLFPNLFDIEGSWMYKFNWEKRWGFTPTGELS